MDKGRQRIEVFDALRAIAMMLVVLSHMTFMTEYFPWFVYFLNGHYSVVLFFILSGFSMMLGYGDRFHERITVRVLREFMGRRMKRIYPLYLLTLLIFLLYSIAGDVVLRGGGVPALGYLLVRFIPSVCLLQTVVPLESVALSFNSVAWFLSALFVLYLVTPYLIRLVRRLVKRLGGMILLGAMLAVFLILSLLFSWADARIPGLGLAHFSPYINVCYYLTGMVLGQIYRERSAVTGAQEAAVSKPFATIAEAVVLLACILLSMGYRVGIPDILYSLLKVLSLSALIWCMALGQGALSRALGRSAVLKRLGQISFEMYLIHYPVCVLSERYILTRFPGSGAAAAACMAGIVILSLILSVIWQKMISEKMRRSI